MIVKINSIKTNTEIDIFEKKYWLHPDSIADRLADILSVEYSRYTMKRFGVILHHNFDKLMLMGGESEIDFGKGKLIKPIRILLNGRASISFADENIDVKELLKKWTEDFIKKEFPMLNTETDIRFIYETETGSSPGAIMSSEKNPRIRWFKPRSLDDLPELKRLNSNDSSIDAAYYPLTKEQEFFINLEKKFKRMNKKEKWIGGDIKLEVAKFSNKLNITLAIPQISTEVKNLQEYINNKNYIKEFILDKIVNELGYKSEDIDIIINGRDDYAQPSLYLTYTGSSIETGDEGVVGRGNRMNGLITPLKPMSIEGHAGKNPVYHAGKLYNMLALLISIKIYDVIGKYNEVILISQSGRPLKDPRYVMINIDNLSEEDKNIVRKIVEENLTDETIRSLTNAFIKHGDKYGYIDIIKRV